MAKNSFGIIRMGYPIKEDSLVSQSSVGYPLKYMWITVRKKYVTRKLKLACWNGS